MSLLQWNIDEKRGRPLLDIDQAFGNAITENSGYSLNRNACRPFGT